MTDAEAMLPNCAAFRPGTPLDLCIGVYLVVFVWIIMNMMSEPFSKVAVLIALFWPVVVPISYMMRVVDWILTWEREHP